MQQMSKPPNSLDETNVISDEDIKSPTVQKKTKTEPLSIESLCILPVICETDKIGNLSLLDLYLAVQPSPL